MGFFQELKEDLSQAVNELVPDDSAIEETLSADEEAELLEAELLLEEEALFAAAEQSMGIERTTDVEDMIAASEELDKKTMEDYTATLNAVADRVMEESFAEPAPEPVYEPAPEPVYEAAPEPVYEPAPEPAYEPAPEPVYEAAPEPVVEEVVEEEEEDFISDEVATITRMMTINGDVASNGSIDIIGAVNGNVAVKGKITVTGAITGNSQASDIYAQGATINGDLISSGAIKIGANTVIRGNIYATSAVIAGAVKGDIDVHGPVILDSTAIVMGNIKSKAVQINNGAAIEGMCSQCYADVSPSAFFKD